MSSGTKGYCRYFSIITHSNLSEFEILLKLIAEIKSKPQRITNYGLMMVSFIVLATIPVPIIYVVSGYDPFRYLLDYTLPHPMYRSIPIIVGAYFARIVVSMLLLVECFRAASLWVFLLVTGVVRMNSLINFITHRLCRRKPMNGNKLAQQLCIIWNNMENLLAIYTNLGLNVTFALIVMFTWLCVKGSTAILGAFIYTWFVLALLGLSIAMPAILGAICCMYDRINDIFCALKMRDWFLYARHLTVERKVALLKAKSLVALKVVYTPIGALGRNFLVTYLEMLLARIFDAILVIDFRL